MNRIEIVKLEDELEFKPKSSSSTKPVYWYPKRITIHFNKQDEGYIVNN